MKRRRVGSASPDAGETRPVARLGGGSRCHGAADVRKDDAQERASPALAIASRLAVSIWVVLMSDAEEISAMAAVTGDVKSFEGNIGVRRPSSRVQAAVPVLSAQGLPCTFASMRGSRGRTLGPHVLPRARCRASRCA